MGVKTGGVCEVDERGEGGLVSLGEGTDMVGWSTWLWSWLGS
jgi:hypothetical protein